MYLKHQITQADKDRAASHDTTTATDSIDSSITATFSEGKGFIPIDLSLELEGMSGMLLFQKLKVDNLILPYPYINKIDFIIQAMDHTIQNNEWTTTLSTLSVPKRKNLRNNNSNEDTIFSRLQTPVSFNITELNNSLVRNVLS